MGNGESENLVAAVADRVREALVDAERRGNEFVAEAERRAGEIVADAEAKAERILADAEAQADRRIALAADQARERVARARKALEELGEALGRPSEEPAAKTEPEPVAESQPEPEPEDDPSPKHDPEDDPDAAPEPTAPDPGPHPDPEPEQAAPPGGRSTEELIAQLRAGASQAAADTGGDAAARLVAMNMALEGASRDEVEQHLDENFDVADREALLDEVFSRVKA